jgi:dihydrofolate reductase
MRKIISITQVSLDGVMQAPGGSEEDTSNGFSHGGWARSNGDEVLRKVVDDIIAGEFDILLGRRTYQIFASYWPHQANAIAKAFNKAAKYVATRTLSQFDWKNSHAIADAARDLSRLKASEGPDLHVWGSSNLLQTLIAADLIDEYRLWVFPVALGQGKRLFENGVPARRLTLTATQETPTGILVNSYVPAGPVK